MILNLADFAHRRAYLIGFGQSNTLKNFNDIEKHIYAAKSGLTDLGFAEQEIRVFRDADEATMPDFN